VGIQKVVPLGHGNLKWDLHLLRMIEGMGLETIYLSQNGPPFREEKPY